MKYAFIKNNKCFNIVVFNDIATIETFKAILIANGTADDIVPLEDGYGIGDLFNNGNWSKQEQQEAQTPSIDDRLTAIEEALLFITLGGEQ